MTATARLESIVPRTTAAAVGPRPSRIRSRTTAHERREQITPRTSGLFGLFGTGNSGNNGSLEAMLQFVRRMSPDAEIICICAARRGACDRLARSLHVATRPFGIPPPDHRAFRAVDRLLLTLPRRIASLVHMVRQARKLGALIVPGTGILADFGVDRPPSALRARYRPSESCVSGATRPPGRVLGGPPESAPGPTGPSRST